VSSSAVILLAHGARDPEWTRPFEVVRDRLRAEGIRTELAYLEIMTPSLEEAAELVASEGVKTVTIVPLLLGQGRHLKHDLPEMISDLKRNRAGVEFRVTPALGDDPEILAAITAWAKRAAP
jgi:sirohydrochlorin cobaltochelatase